MSDEYKRYCKHDECGKELVRKTRPNGTIESKYDWLKREFCNNFCSGKWAYKQKLLKQKEGEKNE